MIRREERRGRVLCPAAGKPVPPGFPRARPKEASGNCTEPASLGGKQSAAPTLGIRRRRAALRTAGVGERRVSHAPPSPPVAAAALPPGVRLGARPARPRPRSAPGPAGLPPQPPAAWRVARAAEPVTSGKDQTGRGGDPASGGQRPPPSPGHASAGVTSRRGCGPRARQPLEAPGCGGGSPAPRRAPVPKRWRFPEPPSPARHSVSCELTIWGPEAKPTGKKGRQPPELGPLLRSAPPPLPLNEPELALNCRMTSYAKEGGESLRVNLVV